MLNTLKTTRHKILGIAAAVVVAAGMPAASALAAPAAISRAQGVELTVTGDTANVRSGPSTADPIIGVAAQGAKLVADAKTADGAWFRITFEGKQGYVFAQLVTAGGAAAPAACSSATSSCRTPSQSSFRGGARRRASPALWTTEVRRADGQSRSGRRART